MNVPPYIDPAQFDSQHVPTIENDAKLARDADLHNICERIAEDMETAIIDGQPLSLRACAFVGCI